MKSLHNNKKQTKSFKKNHSILFPAKHLKSAVDFVIIKYSICVPYTRNHLPSPCSYIRCDSL